MRTPRLIADRYSLVEPLPGSATGSGWRVQGLWSGQLVAITRVSMPHLMGHELLRAALGRVPGLDASRRSAGFAGWLCLWGDNPAFFDEPCAGVDPACRSATALAEAAAPKLPLPRLALERESADE